MESCISIAKYFIHPEHKTALSLFSLIIEGKELKLVIVLLCLWAETYFSLVLLALLFCNVLQTTEASLSAE